MSWESTRECRGELIRIMDRHLGGVAAHERIDSDFVELCFYILPGVGGGDAKAEAWGTVTITVWVKTSRVEICASIVWNPILHYRGAPREGLFPGAQIGLVSSGCIVIGTEEERSDSMLRGISEALRSARQPPFRAMTIFAAR
jgi:hypothetical protein